MVQYFSEVLNKGRFRASDARTVRGRAWKAGVGVRLPRDGHDVKSGERPRPLPAVPTCAGETKNPLRPYRNTATASPRQAAPSPGFTVRPNEAAKPPPAFDRPMTLRYLLKPVPAAASSGKTKTKTTKETEE